jgi:nucleotide-binding universal stress UspA family protein
MSFHDIAVGVDLSSESERAAAQAMALARRNGARVVLIHVGLVPEPPTGVPESSRATAETFLRALQARTAEDRAQVEALRQRLIGQGVELSHVVVEGFADAALPDTARELGCDLIVVGTHGRTGVRRFLLGSVAERTVRHASSSVLIARGEPHAADGGFHRLVVGTDFSELADNAMARAVDVAADGATIRVVYAWMTPSLIGPENAAVIGGVREAMADDAQKRSGELLTRYRKAYPRVAIEMDTCEAPATQALVERAEALGADLIAVGSHGRRGVRRLVLGSVAEVTVRHAPCSVLVAR